MPVSPAQILAAGPIVVDEPSLLFYENRLKQRKIWNVTYIEADAAPYKNTGVIRLYGPEGFEGMRKACQVTARWPGRARGAP